MQVTEIGFSASSRKHHDSGFFGPETILMVYSVCADSNLNAHWDLASRNSAANTNTPLLLLNQRKDSIGRHDGSVVHGKVFKLVLNDLSGFGFEAVHADSIYIQWFAHGHFRNKCRMP